MTRRAPPLPLLAAALLSLGVAAPLLVSVPARGADEDPAAAARAALEASIARGKVVWSQRATPDGKSCADCHGAGPNALRAARLKSYPKYDAGLGKVVSGQQKLNAMLEAMVKSPALPLGSDDLNALEAYVSTLR